MSDQKLAVIFPGIGYHKDKPLLYYAAKMAVQHGYELFSIEYHDMPQKIRGNSEMMHHAAELAVSQSREAMRHIRLEDYADILLIGKSIGTIAAACWDFDCNARIRQIWYTPLEATFGRMTEHPCIAFLGEKDPWSDVSKVQASAEAQHIPLHTYPDCNHSLECCDVMQNLSVLSDVIQKTEHFLEESFSQQS